MCKVYVVCDINTNVVMVLYGDVTVIENHYLYTDKVQRGVYLFTSRPSFIDKTEAENWWVGVQALYRHKNHLQMMYDNFQ